MSADHPTTPAARRKRGKNHGQRWTRLYSVWLSMKTRCTNPRRRQWKDYGGRGITICPEWLDFRAFRDWALASGYRDDLTIERKDTDGNYEPANCTWIPLADQMNNKRSNHRLSAFGETKTLAEWKRDPRCVVPYFTLLDRIRAGWDAERAIATAASISQNHPGCLIATAFGETKRLVDWATDPRCPLRTGGTRGITATIQARIRRGWDAERAISTPVG